jgi:hypothetical protein
MATYRPLIVNPTANQIQEINGSDTLDSLNVSGIVTATSFVGQTLQKTSTTNLAGQLNTTFSNAIQSSTNEVTILFSGVKLPDSGHFLIYAQPTVGNSSYFSNSAYLSGGATSGRVTRTSPNTGLIFYLGVNTNIISGQVTLKKSIRVSSGDHRWIANGTFIYDNNIETIGFTNGYLDTTAAAPVTRIVIGSTTAAIFDAGEVSVIYQ